jgi:DNA polymerase-3 subunit alpha
VQDRDEWEEVMVGGVVTGLREMPLKSGEGRMALFQLEDAYGQIRVACFAKAFAACEAVLKADEPILLTGKVKASRVADEAASEGDVARTKELSMSEAVPLAQLRAEKTRQMIVELSADGLTDERVAQLKAALELHPGGVTTVLRLKVPLRSSTDCILPARYAVTPSDELLLRIERLFGENAAQLR